MIDYIEKNPKCKLPWSSRELKTAKIHVLDKINEKTDSFIDTDYRNMEASPMNTQGEYLNMEIGNVNIPFFQRAVPMKSQDCYSIRGLCQNNTGGNNM